MSFWTGLRDTIENVGLGVADFYTGGAASLLGGVRATSAQDSPIGQIVGIGGDLYGLGNLAASGYNLLSTGGAAGAQAAGSGADSSGSSSGGSLWDKLGNLFSGGSSGTGAGTGAYTSDAGIVNNPSAFTAGVQGVSTPAASAYMNAGSTTGALSGMQSLVRSPQSQQIMSLAGLLGGAQTINLGNKLQNNPYMAQIQALQSNPGSVFGMPGAQAAMDAIVRNQAAAGNLGSGNVQAALAAGGGQLYNNQLQQLQGLAGLQNTQTIGAGQLGLQGMGQIGSALSGMYGNNGGLNLSAYGHMFGG